MKQSGMTHSQQLVPTQTVCGAHFVGTSVHTNALYSCPAFLRSLILGYPTSSRYKVLKIFKFLSKMVWYLQTTYTYIPYHIFQIIPGLLIIPIQCKWSVVVLVHRLVNILKCTYRLHEAIANSIWDYAYCKGLIMLNAHFCSSSH